MKYVIAMETAFHTLDDSNESIDESIVSVDSIREIKNALNEVDLNTCAGISLPSPEDVKFLVVHQNYQDSLL